MSFFWSHFQCSNKYYQSYYPAYSYLFLVINRNTRKMRKICLKNNASDVELVPLLSTLNILQTSSFKYFYCWIWTSKYRFLKAFMTFFWGNRNGRGGGENLAPFFSQWRWKFGDRSFNSFHSTQFNPFQPSTAFDKETSHSICTANKMTGFFNKCNTRRNEMG